MVSSTDPGRPDYSSQPERGTHSGLKLPRQALRVQGQGGQGSILLCADGHIIEHVCEFYLARAAVERRISHTRSRMFDDAQWNERVC